MCCLAAALAGCTSIGYYAESLNGHLNIMAARRDVGKLIEDPATKPALRQRLVAAQSIRQFASDELGLPDNDSYRDFVDIGRDYVTLAVYAAPEFSLTPKVWCFAVFGCVPYRGFFSEKSARAEAEALQGQGLDVYVSGVIAYSTLGWSSDPLLNTMFGDDELYLAGLVFHELAHQRVYIEGDSAFNEAFAVAVETTGVEKWLRATGDRAAMRRFETGRRRQTDFLELVANTKEELARIYASDATVEQKRAAKAAAIEMLRARYKAMRDRRWGGYKAYDGWFAGPINNAKLAAVSVYSDRVPAFLRLFKLCSSDHERFYDAVRRIGSLAPADRLKALETAESC